ncbi:MAG: hypothetical protein CMJ79_05225 [Planctomycetaceae bacterium]|nr:hypothetical protein [Planctomycetaceae bacterium]|tara:strand:+ start:1179 stop:2204 length:1026 start_codon:yes stop_codon:yes gene_type:complete
MHLLKSLSLLLIISATAWSADDLEKRASWNIPDAQQIRTQLDQYLVKLNPEESIKLQIGILWDTPLVSGDQSLLLDQLINSLILTNPDVAKLVGTLESTPATGTHVTPDLFNQEGLEPLLINNLKLYYARWLAQSQLQDECLSVLEGMKPQSVVDPATLLFYQATGYHRILAKEKCLTAIELLLENEEHIPRRYSTLANLMKADITPLKKDSLDEVARLMSDIQRRLKLGRAGTRVRQEEDDVVAKLDKMIEELEKQQQQQQQSGQGSGSLNPSSPAQDSTPLGGSGPGNVDRRNQGAVEDWGSLPPKERQKALQQISKELPAHYREVIEEYFRKLARDGG